MYGNERILSALAVTTALTSPAAAVGIPDYVYGYTQGAYGPPLAWPLVPLHTLLLPDGRVLNYGTDENGQQGARRLRRVDPRTNTHMTLPNLPDANRHLLQRRGYSADNRAALITGGDRIINGVRNFSASQTELFNPAANAITAAGNMLFARWYPTTVTLKRARWPRPLAVLGGPGTTLAPRARSTAPQRLAPPVRR